MLRRIIGRPRNQSFAPKGSGKTLKEALRMSGKDLGAVTLGFVVSLLVGAGGNKYVVQSIQELFSG